MSDEGNSPDWLGYGADQVVIEQLVRSTFGDKCFESREERAARILEEAAEIYQKVCGNPTQGEAKAHLIVKEVFKNPPGELNQEIGGLGICLLAMCANVGVRLDRIVDAEIQRINSREKKKFREKQKKKADAGIAMRPDQG